MGLIETKGRRLTLVLTSFDDGEDLLVGSLSEYGSKENSSCLLDLD